jgi:hypothetical protein
MKFQDMYIKIRYAGGQSVASVSVLISPMIVLGALIGYSFAKLVPFLVVFCTTSFTELLLPAGRSRYVCR